MKKYQQPEMEVINISMTDTMTVSGGLDGSEAGGNEGGLGWGEI